MRTSPWLALALTASAAGCAGSDGPAAAFWAGDAGAPRVLAVDGGGRASVAAQAPALDAPVRALALRGDGAVVALQDVAGGAPPGVVLGRDGSRLAALAATDDAGAPLFDAAEPPWAAAEAADGRTWVTGRAAPVLFDRGGALVGAAAPLAFPTRGVAALADGRMLVTYGANGAAVYAPGGASVELLAIEIGSGYSGVDAVGVRPDGRVVLAALHHGVTTDGVLVDVAIGPGKLSAVGDPRASAALPALPSAIAFGTDAVVAGPPLGSLSATGCAEVLSSDLRDRRGCLAEGAHRGVVRVP